MYNITALCSNWAWVDRAVQLRAELAFKEGTSGSLQTQVLIPFLIVPTSQDFKQDLGTNRKKNTQERIVSLYFSNGRKYRKSELVFYSSQGFCKPLNPCVKSVLLKIPGLNSGSCMAPAQKTLFMSSPTEAEGRDYRHIIEGISESHVPDFRRGTWLNSITDPSSPAEEVSVTMSLWGPVHWLRVRVVSGLPEATELGSQMPLLL